MKRPAAQPMYSVGFGCRRGCPAATLRELLEQALLGQQLDLRAVGALASIDQRKDEPGLLELARQLDVPLLFFSSVELAPYESRLSQRSQASFEHTGCYGVAESAALALAERSGQACAKLLISRKKHPKATVALAWTGQNPR